MGAAPVATAAVLDALAGIPAGQRPLWIAVSGTDDLAPGPDGRLSSSSPLRGLLRSEPIRENRGEASHLPDRSTIRTGNRRAGQSARSSGPPSSSRTDAVWKPTAAKSSADIIVATVHDGDHEFLVFFHPRPAVRV